MRVCSVSRLQYPLGYYGSIISIACNIPCRQFLVAIQKQAIAFETIDEFFFHRQRTIIFCNLFLDTVPRPITVEVIVWQTSRSICNFRSPIDRGYHIIVGNISIEHAVHHHRCDSTLIRSLIIITDNSSLFTSPRDVSITITVDDASCTIKKTYKTASVSRAAYLAAKDTHIVDASCAIRCTSDSTSVAIVSTNANAFQHKVLYRTCKGGEQRCT